jgi:PAS domain S-box-containing protein
MFERSILNVLCGGCNGARGTGVTGEIETLVDSEGALLATVLDQTHDCVKLLNLDGLIEYVNRQGALAMELSSPSELIGQSYLARWPEEVRPKLERALAAAHSGELGRFTASRPQPNGAPSWWDVTVSPVRGSTGAITHFVTIAREMTAEVTERERVEAISLEMRHRLKNALTVASGIVILSARGRPEVSDFANEIAVRLGQLSNVQALILDPEADKSLGQMVVALAGAYGSNAALEFGTLPEVKLSDRGMQALALCCGELATNSLKYGALRNGGRVRIDGETRDGIVELSWCEETEFGAARPEGQGLHLIERLIRTAGGTFRRVIDAGQMRAIMTLPLA